MSVPRGEMLRYQGPALVPRLSLLPQVATTLVMAGALAFGTSSCAPQVGSVSGFSADPVIHLRGDRTPESELLVDLVAGALTRSGARVDIEIPEGDPVDLVAAVAAEEIDVTVGHSGDLLLSIQPQTWAMSSSEVFTELVEHLPEGVAALGPSRAEDRTAFVVSKNTSLTMSLSTMSALVPLCRELKVGGSPELLPEITGAGEVKNRSGCHFADATVIDGDPQSVVAALRAGTIGVGVLSSVDPAMRAADMVVLDDDNDLIRAQNITVLHREGALSENEQMIVEAVLEALTAKDLAKLLDAIRVGWTAPVLVADSWLSKNDF